MIRTKPPSNDYRDGWDRVFGEQEEERRYPCARCGVLRTKAEGGTVFTVCDVCWEKAPSP
jgi:hypothetical protein